MIQIFHDINVDWLGKRRIFIGLSIVLMLAGMGTRSTGTGFIPAARKRSISGSILRAAQ